MMSSATEVIEFELFRNAVFSIADEMAVTILRTAYSGVLKSVMDYATAVAAENPIHDSRWAANQNMIAA
jgi:N-methylhydantoinase B